MTHTAATHTHAAYGHCPSCNASFDGSEIPESIRQHYSAPYRWSRRISIIDPEVDGVVAHECPDCHHRWPADRSAT